MALTGNRLICGAVCVTPSTLELCLRGRGIRVALWQPRVSGLFRLSSADDQQQTAAVWRAISADDAIAACALRDILDNGVGQRDLVGFSGGIRLRGLMAGRAGGNPIYRLCL